MSMTEDNELARLRTEFDLDRFVDDDQYTAQADARFAAMAASHGLVVVGRDGPPPARSSAIQHVIDATIDVEIPYQPGLPLHQYDDRTVLRVLPRGYARYVRVLLPIRAVTPQEDPQPTPHATDIELMSWREFASRNGVEFDPVADPWDLISESAEGRTLRPSSMAFFGDARTREAILKCLGGGAQGVTAVLPEWHAVRWVQGSLQSLISLTDAATEPGPPSLLVWNKDHTWFGSHTFFALWLACTDSVAQSLLNHPEVDCLEFASGIDILPPDRDLLHSLSIQAQDSLRADDIVTAAQIYDYLGREGGNDFAFAKLMLETIYERRGDQSASQELNHEVLSIDDSEIVQDALVEAANTLAELGDLARAERLLLRSVAAGRSSSLIHLADLWDERGEHERATEYYERARAFGEDAGFMWFGIDRAQQQWKAGHRDAAEVALKELAAGGWSDSLEAQFALGELYYFDGDNAQAREVLNELVAQDDSWLAGQAREYLASISIREGDDEAAEQILEQLLADDTFHLSSAAWKRLGLLRLRKGDTAGAEAACRELIQNHDAVDAIVGLRMLARIADERGDFVRSDALLMLATSIAGDSGFSGTWFDRGYYLAQRGDSEGAAQAYAEAIAADDSAPAVAAAMANLGYLAEQRGDLASAEELYEKAIEKNPPGAVGTLRSLGRLLSARGALDRAEALYERAFAEGQTSAQAELYLNLGSFRRECGDLRGSRDALERVLELTQNPEHRSQALNDLGVLTLKDDDLAVAQDLFERAIAATPSFQPTPLINLARVLDEVGDHEGAESLFRQVFDIENRDRAMQARLRVAEICEARGDFAAARELFGVVATSGVTAYAETANNHLAALPPTSAS